VVVFGGLLVWFWMLAGLVPYLAQAFFWLFAEGVPPQAADGVVAVVLAVGELLHFAETGNLAQHNLNQSPLVPLLQPHRVRKHRFDRRRVMIQVAS